jgi:hypothetical protein
VQFDYSNRISAKYNLFILQKTVYNKYNLFILQKTVYNKYNLFILQKTVYNKYNLFTVYNKYNLFILQKAMFTTGVRKGLQKQLGEMIKDEESVEEVSIYIYWQC